MVRDIARLVADAVHYEYSITNEIMLNCRDFAIYENSRGIVVARVSECYKYWIVYK